MINNENETNEKLKKGKKIDDLEIDDLEIDDVVPKVLDDDPVDDDPVDDDEDDDDDEPDSDETVYFKFSTTNHKMEGKHRLKRDTIFNGKLDEEDEDIYSSNSDYYNKDFPIEKGTSFENESRNFEEMESQRQLKISIYNILTENTELDFTSNRRKPNKQAFNNYYEMLLEQLKNRYTKSEIFVELSYYFTDHIFNMYKLLNPEHATNIIMELRDKGYLDELDDMKFV